MLYLESFTLPSEGEESNFLLRAPKCRRTCYTSRYPFGIFPQKQLTEVTFSPITIAGRERQRENHPAQSYRRNPPAPAGGRVQPQRLLG